MKFCLHSAPENIELHGLINKKVNQAAQKNSHKLQFSNEKDGAKSITDQKGEGIDLFINM